MLTYQRQWHALRSTWHHQGVSKFRVLFWKTKLDKGKMDLHCKIYLTAKKALKLWSYDANFQIGTLSTLYHILSLEFVGGSIWTPFWWLEGDLQSCCWLNKYWETDSCQNTNMVDGMQLFYSITGNKKPLLLWLLPPPSYHRRVINIHLSATLANQQHPRAWIFRIAELFVFVYFHIWGYVF